MDHELEHHCSQLTVVLRDLSRDEAVNVFRTPQLGVAVKEDNEVHVGEASLLKLNGVYMSNRNTEGTTVNVMEERVHLQLEDPGDQVMPVSSSLAREELPLDLRPVGVGSGSDEEVCTTIEPVDGQSILAALNHVTLATSEGRGEDDPLALVGRGSIRVGMDSIDQALIEVTADVVLIVLYPPENGLLSACPGITHELLEEPACPEDVICLSSMWKEAIGKELPLRDVLVSMVAAGPPRSLVCFHARSHVGGIMMGSIIRTRSWISSSSISHGHVRVPTQLASGEEEHILHGEVKGVQLRNASQATTAEEDDDVSSTLCNLFRARDNSGHLISGSGETVASSMCGRVISQSDPAVGIIRHVGSEVHGITVQMEERMVLIDESLHHLQHISVQLRIVSNAVFKGILRVIEVELSIGGPEVRNWKEASNNVMDGTLHLVHPWAMAIIDSIVNTEPLASIFTQGSHCKSTVELTNLLPEMSPLLFFSLIKPFQLSRQRLQWREQQFALQTAQAKVRMKV